MVVPVFNEEEAIPVYLDEVRKVLRDVTDSWEIIFAMDPSTDRTEAVVLEANRSDPRVKLLKFTRRFGQPGAIWGGMVSSSGRAVIVMDVDLQDPPEVIPELVRIWREGQFKVVIPQRRSREGENPVKKMVAWAGYWFINKTSRVSIPRNCGDYRLLDRRVVDELLRLTETNAFLRGLTAVVGYPYKLVPFDRKPRSKGEGKYFNLTGDLSIGFNGVIAFSGALLRLMTIAGFVMSGLAIVLAAALFIGKIYGLYQFGTGIATLTVLTLFLTGCQFVGLGILGAYIGRIYEETKRRPVFLVEKAVGFGDGPPPGGAA